MPMAKKLTPKQEAFAVTYVRLQNASAAYREVHASEGMADKTVNEAASRLLKNSKVAARVGAIAEPIARRVGLDIEEQLYQARAISQFDRRKLYRADGTPIPMHELDAETAACISHEGPYGLVPFDKLRALDMTFKHMGMYERDNSQRQPNLKIQIALVAAPKARAV